MCTWPPVWWYLQASVSGCNWVYSDVSLYGSFVKESFLSQKAGDILPPKLYHHLYSKYIWGNFNHLAKGASLLKFFQRILLLRYAGDSLLVWDVPTWILCQSCSCYIVIRRVSVTKTEAEHEAVIVVSNWGERWMTQNGRVLLEVQDSQHLLRKWRECRVKGP